MSPAVRTITRSRAASAVVALLAAAAVACGGGTPAINEATPGQSHAPAGDDAENPGEESDPELGADNSQEADPSTPEADKPAVTFRLHNTADQDLVFSLDKGWQPVLFAFSGKPPKAKSILMFPKFCTASCDAAAAEQCPYCPEPERVKDIKAAEKREVVGPGKWLDVPWDAQVYIYEKGKGERNGRAVKCECFRTEPVPDETYTVRACGFRLTSSASTASKYQCVEGQMTFPAEEPQVVELAFPAP